MLLRKFSVENFKSVDFSNEVEIGRITCLMGKNESGKTALLEALYKLNPVEAEVAKYNDLEYPRKKLGDLRNEGGVRTKNVITTWWELTDEEVDNIESNFFAGFVKKREVKITKGYKNVSTYYYEFDEEKLQKKLIAECKFDATELAQIKSSSLKHLRTKLIALEGRTM